MKKQVIRAYAYYTTCLECKERIPVHIALSDFGDAPNILKCKTCDTLYAYTTYDEWKRPLEEQLKGMTCEKCNADLSNSLVPTHTHIKCCNYEFSLDDNFADSFGRETDAMEDVEVYFIY